MQQQQLAALIESNYDYTRPRRGEVHQAVILADCRLESPQAARHWLERLLAHDRCNRNVT